VQWEKATFEAQVIQSLRNFWIETCKKESFHISSPRKTIFFFAGPRRGPGWRYPGQMSCQVPWFIDDFSAGDINKP